MFSLCRGGAQVLGQRVACEVSKVAVLDDACREVSPDHDDRAERRRLLAGAGGPLVLHLLGEPCDLAGASRVYSPRGKSYGAPD